MSATENISTFSPSLQKIPPHDGNWLHRIKNDNTHDELIMRKFNELTFHDYRKSFHIIA